MRPSLLTLSLLATAPAAAQAPSFDAWSLAYGVPPGWHITQQIGRVHVLSAAGATIYVGPGMYAGFNDVAVELNKGFQSLGLTGMPTGTPRSLTIQGMQAMAADYVGQNQMGQPLRARAVAVLTAHGTGLVILGLAPMAQPGDMAAAVDQIAHSVRAAGAPRTNDQLVAALRGRWMYYAGRADGTTSASGGASRSHEEFVEFDGRSRFAYQSSSSVMVATPGLTGSAGGAQSASDDGTYTVIGTTLVLRGRQGTLSFELQLAADRLTADGRTYLRTN
jgi:hypothetical protein